MQRIKQFKRHSLNVEKAVNTIHYHKGQISVEDLAQNLKISTRHLERKFDERIGLSPKQLCQIFCFKNIFYLLTQFPQDWASIALECGYYDQAHLIRDFKRYMGLSPNAYIKRQRDLNQLSAALNVQITT